MKKNQCPAAAMLTARLFNPTSQHTLLMPNALFWLRQYIINIKKRAQSAGYKEA